MHECSPGNRAKMIGACSAVISNLTGIDCNMGGTACLHGLKFQGSIVIDDRILYDSGRMIAQGFTYGVGRAAVSGAAVKNDNQA